MPSVQSLLDSSSPLVTILLDTTGSTKGTTALVSGLFILGVSGNMGVVSSVSRLTWAWARDGGEFADLEHDCYLYFPLMLHRPLGLPQYFGYVDGKHRVPFRAVILVCVLTVLLSLLNIGSGTYIAFSAITSLSSMAMYLSYAIVMAAVLYARLTKGIKLGAWNLGRAGLPINLIALIYTVYAFIWLPFPNYLPVTASNMNYAGPVLGAVLVGAVTLWFMRAKEHWDGPNRAIIEFILENDEK